MKINHAKSGYHLHSNHENKKPSMPGTELTWQINWICGNFLRDEMKGSTGPQVAWQDASHIQSL
jgi:hypothetical protein